MPAGHIRDWRVSRRHPRKGAERARLLARAAGEEWSVVFFEAPTRLAGLLQDLASVAGAGRWNPELALGMAGPLASAVATWIAVERAQARAPEKVTGVLVAGGDAVSALQVAPFSTRARTSVGELRTTGPR